MISRTGLSFATNPQASDAAGAREQSRQWAEQPARSFRGADEKLRLIEEKCSVGHWTIDATNGAITWSAGLYRILGLDPRSVQPTSDLLESLVHPGDLEKYRVMARHARSGLGQEAKLRVVRPDGFCRWVRMHFDCVTNNFGAVTSILGMIVDITEAENWQSALATEMAVLQLAREMTGLVVWQADISTSHLPTSWQVLYGDDRLPNLNPFEGVHESDEARVRDEWRRARSVRQPFAIAFRRKSVDGAAAPALVKGLMISETDRRGERWVVVSMGVASLRETIRVAQGQSLDPTRLTPAQIRAARGILNWSAQELAQRSLVSFSTVRRAEADEGPAVRTLAMNRICGALRNAGIDFTTGDEGLSVSFAPQPEPVMEPDCPD